MSAILELPPEIQLELLAEGAANIVYRLKIPQSPRQISSQDPPTTSDLNDVPSATSTSTPPPADLTPPTSPSTETDPYAAFRDSLLRLRKDVPWLPTNAQLLSTQEELIHPLFSLEHLVVHRLIKLPRSTLATLNAALRESENRSRRPKQRHGLYLAEDERHGLLVTDMTPNTVNGEVGIELKPKWLAPSPSAPGDSVRCRTCALRAMRAAAEKPGHAAGERVEFCPLDLASGEEAGVRRAVDAVVAGVQAKKRAQMLDSDAERVLAERVTEWLLRTPLIRQLKELQQQLDPGGVLDVGEGEAPSTEFLVATTLRDCTLFLKVRLRNGGDGSIEGRLGDLDIKAPGEGKLEYWKEIERALVEDGWYQGRSAGVDETLCRLQRQAVA